MAVDPNLVYKLSRELATDVLSFVAQYAEEWDGGDKGYIGAELHFKADELLDAIGPASVSATTEEPANG